MKEPPPADKYVGIYTRVSTDIQVDRDSLPMQRKDLLAYAELILGVPPDRCIVYEDAGYSGKDLKRPRFQEMMAAARRGELSHILVWKIDRISRNLLDFIQLYEELKKLKVTFIKQLARVRTYNCNAESLF